VILYLAFFFLYLTASTFLFVDIGAESSSAAEKVQYEGWLGKRNSWGVEWWNQRYFVLRESELCYFEAETDQTPKVRLDMADFTLAYGMAVEDAVGKRHTLQLTIKRDRVRIAGVRTLCVQATWSVLRVAHFVCSRSRPQISSTKKKKKGKGEEDTEKVYTLAAADGATASHCLLTCLPACLPTCLSACLPCLAL
jgi:hypothetical protein